MTEQQRKVVVIVAFFGVVGRVVVNLAANTVWTKAFVALILIGLESHPCPPASTARKLRAVNLDSPCMT